MCGAAGTVGVGRLGFWSPFYFCLLAARRFAVALVHQAVVAADAVLGVHHRVARAQLREVAQHALDRGLAGAVAALARPRGAGIELGFGDDGDAFAIQDEAVQQRPDGKAEAGRGRQEPGEAGAGLGMQSVLGEVLDQGLAAAGGLREQQRAHRGARDERLQPMQRVARAALDGDLGQGLRRDAVPRFAWPGGLEVGAGERARRDEERLGGEEQLAGREHGPRPVAAQELVARLRVAPEVGERLVHVPVQGERRLRGQVVEQGRRPVEEQRQVVFDAGRRDAVAHVPVHGALGGVALEGVAEPGPEAGAARLVHREFARRQQPHLAHLVDCALRVDVEGADRVDQVVLEVDAVGQRAAHRIQVDQPAANAVLARGDDLRDVLVSAQGQLRAQCVYLQLPALLEEERVGGEVGGRGEAVQRGGCRDDEHVEFAALQLVQRRQALGDEVAVRGEPVVGERFPVREQRHLERRREPRDLLAQPLGVARLRAQHGDRPRAGRKPGERERVARAVQLG